jgi:hypothetical protein
LSVMKQIFTKSTPIGAQQLPKPYVGHGNSMD